MNILVVTTSLSPVSRSRILAKAALDSLQDGPANLQWLDLRDTALPFCDADAAYNDPSVGTVRAKVNWADGFIVACPIYNYSINSALKNLIELTGAGWEGKVAGFLCAAGGQASYMAIMALATSLMLDFRTHIVPRFVYANRADFEDGIITNPQIADRTEKLAQEVLRVSTALRS